jgi:hypothetical protein
MRLSSSTLDPPQEFSCTTMPGLISNVAAKIKGFWKRIRPSNCSGSAQKSNFNDASPVSPVGPKPTTPPTAPVTHEAETAAPASNTSQHGSPISPVLVQNTWVSTSHGHPSHLHNRSESPDLISVPARPPRKRAVLVNGLPPQNRSFTYNSQIGIQYHEDDSWDTLESPSGDIRKMEKMLKRSESGILLYINSNSSEFVQEATLNFVSCRILATRLSQAILTIPLLGRKL